MIAARLRALAQNPAYRPSDPFCRAPLTNAQWRARLSLAAYRVLRHKGAERPGSSPLDLFYKAGVYSCAGCALPDFDSKTEFDSHTGWPSFYAPIKDPSRPPSTAPWAWSGPGRIAVDLACSPPTAPVTRYSHTLTSSMYVLCVICTKREMSRPRL
jgi:hypothetical protein